MRLLLTRPSEQCEPIKSVLEKKGFEIICFPLIEIHPPKDNGAALQQALEQIHQFDWLILTSQNAVRAIEAYRPQFPQSLQTVAVGSVTAQLARRLGLEAHLPPKPEGVTQLLHFFQTQSVVGKKILYPRSDLGREELAKGLKKMGAEVVEVEAYQTKPAAISIESLRQTLQQGIHAILFFSPSAVRSFFAKISSDDPLLTNISFVPIGMTTALAVDRKGVQPRSAPSLQSLLTAVPG